MTLNDPQYVEAARHLAELTLAQGDAEIPLRLRFLAGRLLGRELTEKELGIVTASLQDLTAYYVDHPDSARSLVTVGDSAPAEQMQVTELAAWTMLVNELMNLDEVLNK